MCIKFLQLLLIQIATFYWQEKYKFYKMYVLSS